MADVVKATAKFVADAAHVPVLADVVDLLLALSDLVAELRGSRGMCEALVADMDKLLPQLTRMVQNKNIRVKAALEDYKELLVKMRDFLEIHLQKDTLTRLASHWNVKEKIKAFYNDRDRIVERMGLDFQEESADRHVVVTNRIDQIMEREKRIEKQAAEEFDELKVLITDSFDALRQNVTADISAVLGGEVLTTLTDIKYQLKYNKAQSESDQKFLTEVFKKAAEAANVNAVPSLSVWYISRADIHFETSPFAAGPARTLHLGTLSSGAKVAVKVVDATEDNSVKGDWFKNEVDRWYPLRHPNVLPLYGACHLTTPRLFVMAHAEKGNFREFLPKHRHLMWKLFLDVAHGLAYLHNRSPPLVHANLKSSNLLVLADGTGVVSDFAFAFARADSNLSEQMQAPSLRWKAPECLQLGPNANPRVQSDVYSLGMCVYEALTGRAPFENLSDLEFLQAVRVRKELPARFVRISDEEWSLITAMCANDFRDRIKMDEVIRLMRVLAAQEKAQRAEQQCQCERGSCSDCGRGFARETSSSVVSTSKSDSSQLSSLLYSTMDAFRHLVGLVWGARSPQIEHGGCAPAPAG